MPRQVVTEVVVHGLPVRGRGPVLEGVVPGQFHHARLALVGGDGRQPDAGQLLEHSFDLARLDAVAADLHLRVGPAQVDQALRVGSHQVTGVVGALPAQGLQWTEVHGVPLGVQVARYPGAADDQLAGFPHRTGCPLAGWTTARRHPSSGSPMRTGPPPDSRAAQDTTVASVGP